MVMEKRTQEILGKFAIGGASFWLVLTIVGMLGLADIPRIAYFILVGGLTFLVADGVEAALGLHK